MTIRTFTIQSVTSTDSNMKNTSKNIFFFFENNVTSAFKGNGTQNTLDTLNPVNSICMYQSSKYLEVDDGKNFLFPGKLKLKNNYTSHFLHTFLLFRLNLSLLCVVYNETEAVSIQSMHNKFLLSSFYWS